VFAASQSQPVYETASVDVKFSAVAAAKFGADCVFRQRLWRDLAAQL